jgi:hypothetical protein
MSSIGNQNGGQTFFVTGSWGQIAAGGYVVPTYGFYINTINVAWSSNGPASTGTNIVWLQSGGNPAGRLAYSNSYSLATSGQPWQYSSSVTTDTSVFGYADGYIPPGTLFWIGGNSSSSTFIAAGAGSSATDIGNTGTGAFNLHSAAGGGFGTLAAYIDYTIAAPHVTSQSTTVSPPGTNITLTGYAFTGATSVKFNGIAASFTVNSDTQITATVPVGGTGTITVTGPGGSGNAPQSFTAGQIWTNVGAGVVTIKQAWTNVGAGVVAVKGIWVPNGAGVKRIW